MCGIAGIFNTDGQPPDNATLRRMAADIAHRGPDGERFHIEGGLGLAHRHLRIIDLSDAALQPMTNEDGTLWLIFNGEIYNYVELRPTLQARGHRFTSHSDSETILHAYEEWGAECLHRFNGMFAFALWDSRRQRLFIARDRMGVKPVYYWWDGGTLAFASEIKALLAHPQIEARPNPAAIAEYMNAMYTGGEHTWFAGVKRLLPGHHMTVSRDGLSIKQWWDVPANEEPPGKRGERAYIRHTREILEDSVRLRLRSDVPLGAHLSGGLDSSAVVALLSRRLAPTGESVRTFSGAFAEGKAYDERRYVHDVVERYGTDHHETLPTAADLAQLMKRMTWHMDEPTAGPGILLQWAVCELSRQAGVTVINGGQGGDEAWGGYFGYIPAYLRTLVKQARRHPSLYAQLLRDALTLPLRPETRTSLLSALQAGRRGRLRPEAIAGAWAGEYFAECGVPELGEAQEPAEYGADNDPLLTRHSSLVTRDSARSPLAAIMYWDTKWYLPALLHVEDRTSMAFSLESRAPLLDYRLIEHAALVPSALKLKGLTMKHILREAVKDLLPPSVYGRTDKKGMPTPIAPWFRGELAGWVREELMSAPSELLARQYVSEALQEHQARRKDRGIDLWKMLSLVAWWRVFIEGDAPSTPSERATAQTGQPVRA